MAFYFALQLEKSKIELTHKQGELKMKNNLLSSLAFSILLFFIIINFDVISQYILNTITPPKEMITLGEKNEYYRNYDFTFVQNTQNFYPNNQQDILNIYYTAINAGKNTFTFNCPDEYENCLNEVKDLANNQTKLSHINNFVHPYNSFKHIETEYNNLGEVTITIQKNYSTELIQEINNKIDYIETNILDKNTNLETNIKLAHDYIINNSKYDSQRSDYNIINYKSDIAYGPLLEGYGICGGYTDAMMLVLERLNIPSYKISSETHVWNGININNTWYHLDLTWDDPVTSTNVDLLEHNFFLINTKKLYQLEQEEHIFDQTVYSELKEA